MSAKDPAHELPDGLSPCERALSIASHRRQMVALAIELDSDSPPTEFRLLKAGRNTTADGREFIFDAEDAAATMAAYAAHKVDRMIDLEHLSIDPKAPNYDPDARAWCQLELRNGELWATNVRWLDDGQRRLGAKLQRYISPYVELENGHVVGLVNIALTALPALNGTPALVAASMAAASSAARMAALTLEGPQKMDPKLVQAALDALESGDAAAALELLKGMLAAALGAAPAPEPVAAEGMPSEAAESAAAASVIMRLAGKSTVGESVADVQTWHASHLELTAERVKLAAERATLELGQRRANAVQLVKLGAETPHTSGLATGTLAARLMTEPLAEQDARVAALLAARGGKLPATASPPTTAEAAGLDARELAICAELKCEPKVFAALKAQRRPATT